MRTTAAAASRARFCFYLLSALALAWIAEFLWSFDVIPTYFSSSGNIASLSPKNDRSENINDEAGKNNEVADESLEGMHDSRGNATHGVVIASSDATVTQLIRAYPVQCKGKERVLNILYRAGKVNLTNEDCKSLPTWQTVTSLYGSEPVVHGLVTCGQYRETLRRLGRQPDPRVDGLFDTGTNAFVDVLNLNFRHHEDRKDYNVPGNKHVLLSNRDWGDGRQPVNYTSQSTGTIKPTTNGSITFLPIVLIRDPYRWMASMCKASYTAHWEPAPDGHCPNLVKPNGARRRIGKDTYPVTVDREPRDTYDSLADMWSEWYYEYYREANFPRLMIRFEDTLFHAEKVMELVNECLLGPASAASDPTPFKYHLDASKNLKSSADFATALAKYGTETGRYAGLARRDKIYAVTKGLDAKLMQEFHYPQIDVENLYVQIVDDLISQYNSTCYGKDRLLRILLRAGQNDVTVDDCKQLPTWNEVKSLYGEEPIVYGLETCNDFRSMLATSPRTSFLDPIPRVDGLFNSGTNAFVDALNSNYKTFEDRLEYNIPEGKHWYPANRPWAKNRTAEVNRTKFFPIVLVKDPFRWMASMVSHFVADKADVTLF